MAGMYDRVPDNSRFGAVVSMCRKLKEQYLLMETPRQAVLPLRTALGKLADSTSLVTPLHADLCQM